MATSEPAHYPLPYPVVFDAFIRAIPLASMKVDSADPQNGIINASSGISFSTWGERVSVRIGAASADSTTAVISSDLKFGLVAWGKHERNFRNLFDAVNRVLAAGAAPPPYPPQQPPGAYPPDGGYQPPPQQPGYPPDGGYQPPPQ